MQMKAHTLSRQIRWLILQSGDGGGTQALINLAPTIPQLRMEVIPMRGRVVRGIPRTLQEIWTTQRRKM